MTGFRVAIDGAGLAFDCRGDETLLDAALRQGIEMSYSCRKGVCGNCRGQLLAGELVAGTGGGAPETGIQAPDEHLFCRARPASDLLIRPRGWQRLDPSARKRLAARVFRISSLAPDVTLLQLRFAAGVRAKFKAGQYLQLLLPDGQRRSYSMANAPHDNDGVSLHVRHLPGGLFSSRLLPALKPGDTLTLELPFGDFWLREDRGRPLVLVAGGTGFAPLRSIVESMLRRQINLPVHLYWGVRSPTTHYAAELVERWRQQLPGFSATLVSSLPPATQLPAGYRGSLVEAVLAGQPALAGCDIYACGSPDMIQALRRCAGQAGLSADNFFSDAFVSG